MANNISYQQARKIRKTKFTDLFVDQLAQNNTGVLGAIGKSISLKSKARVEGIKEKFDPLNIAKFLTFGSKMGPALLGKMLGRNQKDIDYFTGRTRAIRGQYNTADKIKKGPGSEEIGGINEQLAKIHSFLKSSREDDMKLKKENKNFAEELSMEKENRHKELITTLNKLMGVFNGGVGPGNTASKLGFGFNFSDMLGNLKELMDFKKLLGAGDNIKKLFGILGWFASPLGMTLLGIVGTAAFAAWISGVMKDWVDQNVANKNVLSPEKAAELLANPGAYREIELYGGREAVMQIAQSGHTKAQEILDSKDIVAINKAGGEDFLKEVIKKGQIDTSGLSVEENISQFAPKILPRPSGTGSLIPKQQEAWDKKWSKLYAPDGTRLDLVKPLMEGASNIGNENERLLNQAPAPAAPTGLQKMGDFNRMPGATATPMVEPAASPVSSLSNTNTDLNLSQHMSSSEPGVSKTVVNNTKKPPTGGAGLKPSQISVRNDEPTFMRLIEESTRLV